MPVAFIKNLEAVDMLMDTTLYIRGHEPVENQACPVLDPTAAIQIEQDLIEVYQESIDALINQLGKNVLLEFDPIVTACPNCVFDPVNKRSKNVYKSGGPVPFATGHRCPYCKGDGVIKTQSTKCIKCLIKWNPKDYDTYDLAVEDQKGIVRTKGYLTDAPDIERASSAIVNYNQDSPLKLRVRRLRKPVPAGLRYDRYCLTYWGLIT